MNKGEVGKKGTKILQRKKGKGKGKERKTKKEKTGREEGVHRRI